MTDDIWTIRETLDWTEGYLERNGDESPRLSAQWLLSEATHLSRIDLYVNFDRPLSRDERDVLRGWVRRRAQGEPLQLICGKAPFRYLSLSVRQGVLIPRPETEVLVSEALGELDLSTTVDHMLSSDDGELLSPSDPEMLRALDLCTGSGCIACALASEYRAMEVLALDVSDEACALASENVVELGLDERVSVVKSDLFSALDESDEGTFDLIISNPPYIPHALVTTLEAEVLDFEPALALDGGDDGLSFFRCIIDRAPRYLKPDGVLAVELFEESLIEAAVLARKAGFDRVRIASDLAGRDRVLIARIPFEEEYHGSTPA